MERMRINIDEAITALTERPMKAADAERIAVAHAIKDELTGYPQPERFSRYLSAMLDRVSVPLESHDLIAGRAVIRELTAEEEILYEELLRDPLYHDSVFGSGHCSYDWEMVIRLGLPGLIRKARASLKKKTDPGRQLFLQSVIDVYGSIQRYILRYADAAGARGMPELQQTLKKAALEKPTDFRTGLQLLWIITLIDCSYVTPNPTLTLGRLDKLLYPLYRADLDSGRLTREEAAALITDHYCKQNLNMGRGEHQVGDDSNTTGWWRIFNFDAPQYLLLGGTDPEGKFAVNELTELFVECIQPAFKNPVVVFYYAPGMSREYPQLWKCLMTKALQSSSLMIYNDANIRSTYAALGLPPEDIRDHHHFGCNWPSPGSHSYWLHGAPSSSQFSSHCLPEEAAGPGADYIRSPEQGWPDVFLKILREVRYGPDVTIESIYARFRRLMEAFILQKTETGVRELRARRRRPWAVCFFTDCFTELPIEKGECFSACAKYIFALQAFEMFGTVCDCFTTVDTLCFREKKLTIGELLDAVDANFTGYEQTLAMCRNVPKYGSDDALSNSHVRQVAQMMADITREAGTKYLQTDGFFLVPCLQSDTWHLKDGMRYGATPDGRLAGVPFSQNASPANGSCANGLTGLFNSMLNIPKNGYLSGALNLDVDPKQFSGDTGAAVFGAMLAVYLDRGGLHGQVTSVSREALRDAQAHPDRHRDLRVRVTGYSGVFVDICKALQDDIIERQNEK